MSEPPKILMFSRVEAHIVLDADSAGVGFVVNMAAYDISRTGWQIFTKIYIREELIRFGDLEALFKVTQYKPPYSNQKLLVCTVSIELLDGFQYQILKSWRDDLTQIHIPTLLLICFIHTR